MSDIVMNEFDYRRLHNLLKLLRARAGVDLFSLAALHAQLRRARVVKPHQVPPDVVTMNSEFEAVDLDTGERIRGQLVFPAAGARRRRGVSVLSPIGRALFGCRETETREVPTAKGMRRILLERILYQPEAHGHCAL